MTTCPKCNYTRLPSDTAPDYECPRCGIVYAKVRADEPAPVVAAPAQRGTNRVLLVAVAAAVLGAAGWNILTKKDGDSPAPAAPAEAATAQRAVAHEIEQQALAERRRALAEQAEIEKAVDLLDAQSLKWSDAAVLARSTSRIALSGPVATLQALHRDTEAMTVPPCLDRAKSALVSSMELEIRGFVTFMQNAGNMGDLLSRTDFADARDWFALHEAAMTECNHLLSAAEPLGQ